MIISYKNFSKNNTKYSAKLNFLTKVTIVAKESRMEFNHIEYTPSWWLPNGHLQTIFPTLYLEKKAFPKKTERFELPDGDFMDGVWTNKSSGPTVILLHGLQGSTDSHYINSLMHYIYYETNWNALALNLRGCSHEKQRLFRQYYSGDTEDIKFVLNLIKQRNPNEPVAMVGYSLGGNILLKLFGELKYHNLCETGIAVSPPFDIQATAIKIQHGVNRLYQKIFLDDIKQSIRSKFKSYPDNNVLEKQLEKITSLADLDKKFTAPMHGYQSVAEYYEDCSSKNYLHAIRKPTLVVIAKDDPIICYKQIPNANNLPECITFEVHENGGHVGFMSGTVQEPDFWINKRVMAHLSQYLPLGVHS